MFKPTVRFIKDIGKNVDETNAMLDRVKALSNIQVLVGIPEEKSGRKSGGVNNAELLYIHTHGSPLHRIPKRPVIEPAIEAEDNKANITEDLGNAARSALDGKTQETMTHLNEAGMTGQNAARAWFEDSRNGWPKNTEETAKRKLNKLQGKNKQRFNEQISAGASITDSDVSRPLVDTGQLRKAIVYVVKNG